MISIGAERRDADQDRRQGDAVIDATFDANGLADPIRDVFALDHRLAERRIRRRQNQGNQRDAPKADGIKDCDPDQRSQKHRERQPDQQQPHRNSRPAAQQDLQIDQGRVDEQDQDQGDFGNEPDQIARRMNREKPKPSGLTAMPTIMKTIGPVMVQRSETREIKPNTKISSAVKLRT